MRKTLSLLLTRQLKSESTNEAFRKKGLKCSSPAVLAVHSNGYPQGRESYATKQEARFINRKIVLFNTLGGKEMEFIPIEPRKVRLYTCGPTVYDYAHIGNLQTYIFEDLLRRMLAYFGYEVKHVMNITDVGHLTSDADTGEDTLETLRNRYLGWLESPSEFGSELSKVYREEFETAIAHDLNMPQALATVWKMVRDPELGNSHKRSLLLEFDRVLGLRVKDWRQQELPKDLRRLLILREQARASGNYAEADALRAQLLAAGVAVKDTPAGTKWYYTRKQVKQRRQTKQPECESKG